MHGRSLTEQLREIANVHNAFQFRLAFAEDNAFQRIFKDELVRTTTIPIKGFTTTARNKNSFEFGVPALRILFENRKFVIPRASDVDRAVTDLLLGELKSFSWMDGKLQGVGAHDDLVMALWLAVEAHRQSTMGFSFV